jgi:phosphonatase-like hydrolase
MRKSDDENYDMKFDLIFFDLIGTTIKDSDEKESHVIESFYRSFALNGFHLSYKNVNEQRGKRKREAIRQLIPFGLSQEVEDKIYDDFMNLLRSSIQNFSEIPGALSLFKFLKNNNIKIALGSGLPLDFIHALIKSLKWENVNFDYIGSSEEFGIGRPDPVMILDAMNKLKIKNVQKVLKIGDTIVDIQEGKNAGVKTAAVLTGTQKKYDLQKQKPDYLLESILQVPHLLSSK